MRVLVVFALAACGFPRLSAPVDGPPDPDGSLADTSRLDATAVVPIYAHSQTTLYAVDPRIPAATKIGDFSFSTGPDLMFDLAMDTTGRLVGVSSKGVYLVDTNDATTTRLSATIESTFNALAYVPASQLGETGDEVLIGTGSSNDVFRVDPNTGATTQVGAFGAGFISSGDLVSTSNLGTMQVLADSPSDRLARLDPTTFTAHPTSSASGFSKVWGLAYYEHTLYGFTQAGQILIIDPSTGVATVLLATSVAWFGAASQR